MNIPDEIWHTVFERDRGRCRYCDFDLLKSFEDYYVAEIDHLLPQGVPERDEVENLVLACRACNSRLSRAHSLGLTTFETRRQYLQNPALSSGTRKMYVYYKERQGEGWK